MPRLKRKNITISEESLNSLVQEIYNDNHNIRADIRAALGKVSRNVNNPTELAMLGKVLVDLINTEIKNNDTKLSIAKVIKEILGAADKSGKGATQQTINSDEQSAILAKVKEDFERKKQNR